MGIKRMMVKAAQKVGDGVAKLSALSPEQLADLQEKREAYLSEKPDPNDPMAVELTMRLMASNSVEVYNAYINQIDKVYTPVLRSVEYGGDFMPSHNIRYINITKWVIDKQENSLEKLVNVYEVLSNEECNIALVFHRTMDKTAVYLAVTNTKNSDSNRDVDNYLERIKGAISGNFPGSEWKEGNSSGGLPCFNNRTAYSVASATNIPTEKSEKFISQTIEKLLDGIIPDKVDKEYILILLATPIQDVDERKMRLAEIYSGLAPYANWSTGFTFTESSSDTSMATFGINAGVSAGVQAGINNSATKGEGTTDTTGQTDTDSSNRTDTENASTTETSSTADGVTDTSGTNASSSSARGTSQTATNTTGTNSSTSNMSGTNSSVSNTSGTTATSGSSYTDTTTVGGSVTVGNNFVGSASVNTSDSIAIGQNTSSAVSSSMANTSGVSSSITNTMGTSSSQALAQGTSETLTSTIGETASHSVAQTVTQALASTAGSSLAKSVGKSLANTLSHAISQNTSNTSGTYKGVNYGANFGANFARSSNVSVQVGKNETINQNFTNYTIKHTLELLEEQMKRLEQSTALGMWDFAAYVLSKDMNTANNVAHSYLALTQGEESHLSCAAVNMWRGDLAENSAEVREICDYLRELRHPVFAISPDLVDYDTDFYVYPDTVTAATALTGKELAYSLNFPRKSVAGLPVIECAEFGRNIVSYDSPRGDERTIELGRIFHMNHEERQRVTLNLNSLASHVFITGSTGAGKSNTVYQVLESAREEDVHFLVIEPAKGEYKNVFGKDDDVYVYGTNPVLTPLLRINPFSFPEKIHILEHLDRLVEIFNVCWPMYAAMPAVLKSAVEKSYVDCGWDLITSTNKYDSALYPSFSDVARNIKTIIDSSEYDKENKGAYKGSLLTRLQSLTTGINGLIFASDELTGEELFEKNVIVDLSRVGSSETKSLIMGMLVLKLQEFRMTGDIAMNSAIRHITVLEEAHNLLRRTSIEQPTESSNILGKSVEMITNAIAEMRTYGEGFIIADQAPGLMDMAVIRNTNTKIIMRLPDQSDRELVGKAANLNDDQIQELAKLPCGVAAVYQNEWIQPVLCKVDRYDGNFGKYVFEPKENVIFLKRDTELSASLLKCIMDNELFQKGDKEDLRELKSMIIRSGLNSLVKIDFMEYLAAEKETGLSALRSLVYDFLKAEEAIQASTQYDNIRDWVDAVLDKLEPSVKEYSKKQIDLTIALILHEKTVRDVSYRDIYYSFTEAYQNGGGIF